MTILIESDEAAARARLKGGFLRATRTRRYQGEVRSFESPAALFRVFTPARWSLIERLRQLSRQLRYRIVILRPVSWQGPARRLGA